MSDESQNEYFNSYDSINVHNLMLRDESRVTKYRDAILGSKNTFKDKSLPTHILQFIRLKLNHRRNHGRLQDHHHQIMI